MDNWIWLETEKLGAIQPKSRIFNTATGEYAIFKPVSHKGKEVNHAQDEYVNFMKARGMIIYNPLSQRAQLSECFTSLIARNVFGKDKAVENRHVIWKNHNGIASIDFNSDKTHMFVPASDIYWDKNTAQIALFPYDENENTLPAAEMSMQFLKNHMPQLVPDALNMAYIDALTRNHDRHFGNWEIEIQNGEPVCLSPLYDFDASFPILKRTNMSKFEWTHTPGEITTFDDLIRGMSRENPEQLVLYITDTQKFLSDFNPKSDPLLDYTPMLNESKEQLSHIKQLTVKTMFLEPIRKDNNSEHRFTMPERKWFSELCKSECFRDSIINTIKQQSDLYSENGLSALRSIMKTNGLISSVNDKPAIPVRPEPTNRYLTPATTLDMSKYNKNPAGKSDTDR